MAALVLDKVAKSFGATAVIHDVDLAVADGEFTVFVGPSGCGKSTLLRLICGLEEASSGEIRIDGKRVNEVPAADRGLAMVFQSYALYPHMSVRQNMAFGLENVRTPKAEIETRVGKAATLLRLDGLLDRRPTELSGGQRQRVAIGRAIVREPRMFLFDEPLSNLDAELRVSMRSELVALHRRLRTTMIYVTHDQVEAMTMADRIVVLRAGRVEQAGRPLELYNAPANRFVAGFIGSPQMNFLPVTLAGREGRAARVALPGGGELVVAIDAGTLAPGAPLALGVRPEHLRPSGDAGTIVLAVDEVEQLGGSSQLHGRLGDGATRAIVAVAGQTTARRGESIPLAVMPDHVHLFDEAGAALPRLAAP